MTEGVVIAQKIAWVKMGVMVMVMVMVAMVMEGVIVVEAVVEVVEVIVTVATEEMVDGGDSSAGG